ncbi:MAG TPA: AtpZ/AtpI family protein [Dehalococcoidales bacterium]|nr:AtpZ/AtpI family protein [Dehalococcoidales bacterium]
MKKWQLAARLLGVGFFIGGSIVLGLFLGLWLDNKFNSDIIWVVGLILGIVAAFVGVYRMLIPLIDKDNQRRNGR